MMRTALIEHLAIAATLPHREFCERVRELLKLPELAYDSQDEEADLAEVALPQGGLSVTRIYDQENLLDLPGKCNTVLKLSVSDEHPQAGDADWSYQNLVVPIAHSLAAAFQTDVFHLKTWFGPGDVEPRNERFSPPA